MATVTGITVARANAIENASVVGGVITGSNLYLTTKGGAQINAGKVVPDPVAAWPVGSIFMTINPSNPTTLLGGGVWIRWGVGRMPISLDSTDAQFDSIEETGGEKAHQLTLPELPNHNHGGLTLSENRTHFHAPFGNDGGAFVKTGSAGNGTVNIGSGGTLFPLPTGTSTHTESDTHEHAILGDGANAPHNNMPPYIVCYMWKRTS